jgi:hypothetical protein
MDKQYYRDNSSLNYKRKKRYSRLYKTQSEPGETFSNFVIRMKKEEKESQIIKY